MERSRPLAHTRTLYKLCILVFKYTPVIGTLVLTIHCLLLAMGIHMPFMALVVGNSLLGTITMLAASLAFQFCELHRMFITYNFVISACVNYQAVIGFGQLRTGAHILAFSLGLVLLVTLWIRKGLSQRGANTPTRK